MTAPFKVGDIMKLYTVSFTRGGSELNRKLLSILSDEDIKGYTYRKFLEEDELSLKALNERIRPKQEHYQ